MVEAKEIRIVTNLNIRNLIIKTTITRVTMDNTTTHIEPFIKVIITPNLEAEVMARGNYHGHGHGQFNY